LLSFQPGKARSRAEEVVHLQGRIPELWTTGDVSAGQDLGKATISGLCHLNTIFKKVNELLAPFFFFLTLFTMIGHPVAPLIVP
jgi:hypothetical protein